MADKVFLVHGYSNNKTTTYQALHKQLEQNGYDLHHVYLGRYVSLDDEVTIPDLARAMNNELVRHLGKAPWSGEKFHIITHSTGALVVRHWIAKHYVGKTLEGKPFKNLVMLAGPHFGSRLAHHGRSLLARIKFMGDTGKKILNQLELGSEASWRLNEEWLDFSTWKGKGVRAFCLIGASNYPSRLAKALVGGTGEKGSDGVVRVPAGNLNHRRYEVDLVNKKFKKVGEISGVPFGVLETNAHSGDKHGIMNSITSTVTRATNQPLDLILKCLAVTNSAGYSEMKTTLDDITATTVAIKGAFAQLDFRIRDVDGDPVEDYAIVIGHPQKNGELKPANIVAHTHRNKVNQNHFTIFLDMKKIDPTKIYVLSVTADSNTDLVSYDDSWQPIYQAGQIHELIVDYQTTYVDVIINREADPNLFVFHAGDSGEPGGKNPNGPKLHVKWNRKGKITKKGIDWE